MRLLILALAFTLAAPPQTVVIAKKKTGGPTYLVNESFEGTGDPDGAGSNWAAAGTVDWDASDQAYDGSQSAKITSTSISGTISTNTWAGADDIYGRFWLYTDHLTTASSVTILTLTGTGTTGQIKMLGSSDCLFAVAGGGSNGFMSGGCAIPTNTWVRVWWHYTKGTGSNATMRVWWATTDTHPGNGDAAHYAISSNGTNTTQTTRSIFNSEFSGTENGNKWFDLIQCSASILW